MMKGSSDILVENNIVYNTKSGGYNINYGKDNVIINNVFAFGRDAQITQGKAEPYKAFTFKHNIVYWTQGRLFNGICEGTLGTMQLPCQSNFEIDSNLYFNPGVDNSKLKISKYSWEEWRALGNDMHSVYKNPMFKNPESYDFNLMSKSPAFVLGLKKNREFKVDTSHFRP